MTDVAPPSQPRSIPSAGVNLATPSRNTIPPNSLPLPTTQARSFRNQQLAPLDTLSPVTQYGSFEFDRIIKQGEVHKRTRKTKSWKSIFIVLRPNILSIYRDRHETKLRHQVNLSELTAVARQKDHRRKDKHVFALFSPSRNYHLEASSDREAQEWVEKIREAARIDEEEEEMILQSPGGAGEVAYQGFERSIDAHISPQGESVGGYMSSSDADNLSPNHGIPVSKVRDKHASTNYSVRRPSYVSYSGAEGHGSYSDFSDIAGPTSRLSALSLSQADPRPSTSSTQHPPTSSGAPTRPGMGLRSASQMSNLNLPTKEEDPERIVHHSWIYLLKSHRGVRQWKKVWLVIRPKGLAFYKGDDEYAALLILPLNMVIDAVEIDPISKSKRYCMQVISEERNYRFCCRDEEQLTRCLGSLKSLLSKQRMRRKEKETQGLSQSLGAGNGIAMPGAS